MLWNLVYAMDRFAPNGVVRRRVQKMDEKYRQLIGEPTPLMECLGNIVDKFATKFQAKNMFDPFNRYPKEEPFKRYIYDKKKTLKDSTIPYKTEVPTRRSFETWKSMKWNDFKFFSLTRLVKAIRRFKGSNGHKDIDKYLIDTVKKKNFVAF